MVQKPTPPTVYADEMERLIYEATSTRPTWEEDKKTVRNFIIRLLAKTPAKTWIKDHMASQDGSAMIAALRTHFLRPAQVECIDQYAQSKHDKAVYRSQAVYTFECFSMDLQEVFMLLAEYDMEVPQAEQICLLRENIMMDKADFNAATITMLMDGNHITFADAVTRVSQYVSPFFPASSTFGQHGRGNISTVNVSQIAQERHGERDLYNGVDITDFTDQYAHEEWLKIKDLWPRIQAEKDCKSVGKMDGKAKLFINQ